MKTRMVSPWLQLIVMTAWMTSCQHRAPRTDGVMATTGLERPPAPAKILLLENPRRMHEAYTHPANVTKQAFYWKEKEAEWRFKLPTRGYGHAGFRFARPHNFLPERRHYSLIFEMEPAFMTRYLWIGLVDGDDQAPALMTDLPISTHVTSNKRSGKMEVRIPLGHFPDKGIPVTMNEAVERADEQPFDWYDVREIRFIHNGGRLPSREVIITNLRIVR